MTDYYNKYLKYKTKYLELKSNDIDMIGGGKDNKFILVDGTSSAGKSTICKYFSKKNFLCFQIDNYFNDKRINFDNLFKKIKNKYGETDKIYDNEPIKYMVNDAVKTNKNILFDHISQKEIINYMNKIKYDNLYIIIVFTNLNNLARNLEIRRKNGDRRGVFAFKQCDVPDSIQGQVSMISAGFKHSMALLKDGKVVCWGYNSYKQCDVPAEIQGQFSMISAGYHSMALLNDGKVVCWGYNEYNQCSVPASIQGQVSMISAGYYHSMALLNDGKVVCWGYNEDKQCDVPVEIQGQVSMISAGSFYSMALLKDGIVVCWGKNDFKQCDVPAEIQG